MSVWEITVKDGPTLLYDSAALTLGEHFDLKRLEKITIAQLEEGFRAQDPAAWRFVFYLAHTRAGIDPGPYGEIDFAWRDLTIVEIPPEPEPEETDPDLPTGPVTASEPMTGEATPSE